VVYVVWAVVVVVVDIVWLHHCDGWTSVGNPVRSTSLYHCRQCSIVLRPRSDRID